MYQSFEEKLGETLSLNLINEGKIMDRLVNVGRKIISAGAEKGPEIISRIAGSEWGAVIEAAFEDKLLDFLKDNPNVAQKVQKVLNNPIMSKLSAVASTVQNADTTDVPDGAGEDEDEPIEEAVASEVGLNFAQQMGDIGSTIMSGLGYGAILAVFALIIYNKRDELVDAIGQIVAKGIEATQSKATVKPTRSAQKPAQKPAQKSRMLKQPPSGL